MYRRRMDRFKAQLQLVLSPTEEIGTLLHERVGKVRAYRERHHRRIRPPEPFLVVIRG